MSDTSSVFLEAINSTCVLWTQKVRHWLRWHSACLDIQLDLDVSNIVESAKASYFSAHNNSDLVSVVRYRAPQQEYRIAPHLTQESGFELKNRRVTSCFRCACHDLQVDVGRVVSKEQQVPREQRFLSDLCDSHTAEDEHHFHIERPAYPLIRSKFYNIFLVLFLL